MANNNFNQNQNQGDWNNPPQNQGQGDWNNPPNQMQQGGNWGPPPNQQQQYPQQQQGGGNWNQNPQQQGGNWNAPPNNSNQNQPQQQQGGNWQPQQQQDDRQPLHQGPRSDETWQDDPTIKVTQQGNTTITETSQQGGGRSKEFGMYDFAGPSQLGPGNVQSSGPYQPESEQEQIDYFRLKLWESACHCCGGVHPCLNLWIWAIWWLILFMLNGLINLLGYLMRMGKKGTGYSVVALFVVLGSLAVNVLAMIGLFKLKPKFFLLQLVMFVVLLLLVLIGLFVYEFSGGGVITFILFLITDIWAIWVFLQVYRWGKYFKNGGRYDPDMHKPPS
eukprot:192959_1